MTAIDSNYKIQEELYEEKQKKLIVESAKTYRIKKIEKRKHVYTTELKQAINELAFEEKMTINDADDLLHRKNLPSFNYKITTIYDDKKISRQQYSISVKLINVRLSIYNKQKNVMKLVMKNSGSVRYAKNVNSVEYDGLHIMVYGDNYASYGMKCEKVLSYFLEIFDELRDNES